MRRLLSLALACALGAIGCSDSDDGGPPANAAPVIGATTTTTAPVTEAQVEVTASVTDPDTADAISCAFALVSQPQFSDVTLDATSGDCRASALTATFTPVMDGAYVVRVTASDGVQAAPVVRDVAIDVASRYGGGEVAGTAAAPSEAMTQLLADLATIPGTGGNPTAETVFKAFANISGTPAVQGPALSWAERPYDVIDVRDAADFAAGHIPGAINVPLERLPSVLLASPYFPDPDDRRKVLVVGYTQGDSSVAAILVTAARFGEGAISTSPDHRAYYLQDGIAAWTYDKVTTPLRWDDDLGVHRFSWTLADTTYVESSATDFTKTGKQTYELPNLAAFNAATNTATGAPMKRVLVRAREWVRWALADADQRGVPRHEAFVTHWGRYKEARDLGETPQVISAQNATQWRAAHAIGAFRGTTSSTDTTALFVRSTDDLKLLDPSRPVLYHCFSNTGAVSPCFQLSMLGYKARTLAWGITGALDPSLTAAGFSTGFASRLGDKGSSGNDFPVASAASPLPTESFAWAQPSVTGCRECHTNYAALFTAVTLSSTAPAPEVLSEGEG